MEIRIAITTFYNVRHLKPHTIPVSTALWDPKWFHDKTQPGGVYKDKRGIINGLRYESFAPGTQCHNLCHGQPCAQSPSSCMFLGQYAAQLARLDFWRTITELCQMARAVDAQACEVALLVYEKPDNPCSERVALREWFAAHGFTLEEAI